MNRALWMTPLVCLLACSSEDYRSSTGSPASTSTGKSGNAGTAGAGGSSGSSGAGASGKAGGAGVAGGAGASGGGGAGGTSGAGGTAGDAGAAGAAGSGGAVAPCNEHPWDCPAGTTCWASNATGKAFDCRTSMSAIATGSCCKNVIGVPTCGDGDACIGQTTTTSTCKRYCKVGDAAHGCPMGQTCTERTLVQGGSVFAVCEPATTPTCPP